MNVNTAYRFMMNRLSIDAGKFFASGKDLSLGVGKIYSGVLYPQYDEQEQIFVTLEGIVYIITHECDIDQNNIRFFNTEVLICPIIPFDIFIEEYQAEHPKDENKLKSLLSSLAQRKVSRVIYIPQYAPDLPYGGLLYFNQITNTHISTFSLASVKEVCTVTRYGLEIIDQSIENHFLRPKAEDLPLLRY
ncbi:MAG: hypothetical protein DRR08_17275 [Candidatus Parabeggiatoa sp. nov. 2]|nr:MAG: hypothetical protein B6247_06475 [Beggiatoa sp. 4572_84]RKZ58098.1 MAG: hypothetical protein DRR08_17275 [Gammaproteobacteria bacterium]